MNKKRNNNNSDESLYETEIDGDFGELNELDRLWNGFRSTTTFSDIANLVDSYNKTLIAQPGSKFKQDPARIATYIREKLELIGPTYESAPNQEIIQKAKLIVQKYQSTQQ